MKKPKNSRSGFTLLELIVATAVSLVVIVMIVRVVTVMIEQSKRSLSVISTSEEVERVRSSMEQDLRSIQLFPEWVGDFILLEPGSTNSWGDEGWDSVTVDGKSAVTVISENASIEDSMFEERWGREGAQIGFFVAGVHSGIHDPGGIKAVSYQIKRKSIDGDSSPRYYLMRSEVSSFETVEEGYQLVAGDYVEGSFDPDSFWNASVLRYPNSQHVVASNVIDFGIRAFAKNQSNGQWQLLFPGNASGLAEGVEPKVWVVMLRVLSDEGAQMIENLEQGRISGDWWDIAEMHSKIISMKIGVRSH